MKKKVFNQKLNLKKETVVSLTSSQMNGVNGGNAPESGDYGYTHGRDEYGHCVQPVPCPQTEICVYPSMDPCFKDTWYACPSYVGYPIGAC
ncbi:MAG: hypothetical protein EHM93_06265 [Bacteroidales bacterium]|nr:MAG: hypothetical protein EHM93_06265 [Bacteroidales bacterium]